MFEILIFIAIILAIVSFFIWLQKKTDKAYSKGEEENLISEGNEDKLKSTLKSSAKIAAIFIILGSIITYSIAKIFNFKKHRIDEDGYSKGREDDFANGNNILIGSYVICKYCQHKFQLSEDNSSGNFYYCPRCLRMNKEGISLE